MPNNRKSRWRLTSTAIAGLTAASVLGTSGFIPELQREAAAQSLPSFLKRDKEKSANSPQDPARMAATNDAGQAQLRMNFAAANWDDVLKKVAADSSLTLVMDKIPKGRFTRTDLKKYRRTDALRMLNDELEKQDFRVVEQGQFLVVLTRS